jgi:hypothetical protein
MELFLIRRNVRTWGLRLTALGSHPTVTDTPVGSME